jgi:hypothetical protein
MKQVFSITAFALFLGSPSISIAESSCAAHIYKTDCQADASCNWDDKCKGIETLIGCDSHRSEFYCEANNCQWDRMASKCKTKGTGE